MNSYSAIPRRGLLAGIAGLGPLAAAAPMQAQAQAQAARPTVLGTTGMIGDLLRGVGGPAITVETLIGEGVDPHLFRPTRNDIARILRADALFYNGHRLEGRMHEVLERAASQGKPSLAVAEAIPRARLRQHEDYPDAADPHLWMDPALWAETLPAIAATLGRLPRLNRDLQAGAAETRARLHRLDAYAREVLAPIPAERRVLVTAHDAFAYFGLRYEFRVESIQGLSTEAEASLARIEAMVRLIVERQLPALFTESSVPDRAVRALVEGVAARGHQIRLGGTLFSDSMGRPGTYRGTYEGMMDHNITLISRALGGSAPERGLNGRL
ncbi:zinc ABC transporter substrate-binding protein [Sediminicoccus sp. KRV36]|uniref:metal ABC transporter solute-binding protein, Zn/Mn family n=1 Tax=Sediminicoccus sp. KRV36 TaxID=3133721 RepID=UPI00200D2E9B|nr:zinc ABC transporter substrate-binding protein [Sediminicoccus rosea]UPY37969.1 zinc ABC transporter substrate-binding protein [Sediminicoccus rosea]